MRNSKISLKYEGLILKSKLKVLAELIIEIVFCGLTNQKRN